MLVITPTDTNPILQLLSDPKAVKANIQELQAMSEQYQRDVKKSSEEALKVSNLNKELYDIQASIAVMSEKQDNRAAELIDYMAAIAEREARVSEREHAMAYAEEVYGNQKANYALRSDEQNKRQNDLDVQEMELREAQAKLAQDKDAQAEWQLSISSILSSKP